MFADLKNDYESISIAEYSKWIENWLSVLAELVDGENNFDDTLICICIQHPQWILCTRNLLYR